MGIIAGVALLAIVSLSLIGMLLAWTQKIEDEWDKEDQKNWDWHR